MAIDVRMTTGAAASSSPAPAIFSDEAAQTSSPPSSPPGFPWEQQLQSINAEKSQAAQSNAFSILGKRKALNSVSENARPTKKLATSAPAPKALSQMQISLGQTVQKKCKVCGMEYVLSAIEDRKLHDKYHRQNVEGYDVGKDFVRKTAEHAVFSSARKEDSICVVNCHDTAARKRRGQAVLEIVQRELGAVEIPEEELWAPLKSAEGKTRAKYTTYLYIRGTKCVGFLLIQRIEEAFHVLQPPPASDGGHQCESANRKTAAEKLKARRQALAEQLKQPLKPSKEKYPAQLGISRIWTSSTHRRSNIATSLLQAALDHDLQPLAAVEAAETNGKAMQVSDQVSDARSRMAFSQPTEAGTRLARKWFGKDYGWAVYFD